VRTKTRLTAAAACLLSVLPTLALAQQGPTLEVTLNFIRDKLAAEGSVAYTSSVTDSTDGHSWSNQFSNRISNIEPDAASCRLSYHWVLVQNGQTDLDTTGKLPLNQVTDVQMMSMESALQKADTVAGHTTWTSRVNPPIWVIHAMWNNSYNTFYFPDEDTADRVAKAFAHAAQLCGGMKAEPF